MFVLLHYADGKPGRMVEGPFPTREAAEAYSREWSYDPSRNAVLPLMSPAADDPMRSYNESWSPWKGSVIP